MLAPEIALRDTQRRLLGWETALVLAIGVGLAAVRSVLRFVAAATIPGGLPARWAVLIGSQAPRQPRIDLGLQLVSVCALLLPVLLATYLIRRSGKHSSRQLGQDPLIQ
jgi:hypothetical protein